MLETVREYAAERLDSDGEAEEVHRAHAMYYLELAEAAQPEVSARTLTGWLAVLDREHDNMRAALRWTIRHREVDIGTRLALALWRFWPERYHVSEGRRWLEAVLALGQAGGRGGRTHALRAPLGVSPPGDGHVGKPARETTTARSSSTSKA